MALEKKITELEKAERERESHWRRLLDESRMAGMLPARAAAAPAAGFGERERLEAALQAKNAEIERFRSELDGILGSALLLQRQQQAGV